MVFITGASSGLGAALARHYAGRGARLGLLARRADALADTLPGYGALHLYSADVTDPASVAAAAEQFIQTAGVPDIVIGNAGVSVGTLTEHAEDYAVFKRVVEINLLGLVATFQPFVHAMRACGSGRLAGIASVSGIRGLPGAGAYCSSKAGAIAYLESLRVELRGSGVRVCTICPGYIETPMTAVNPYPMPFILPAAEAARRIAAAIDSGRGYRVVPWQMGAVAKMLRLLPNPVFDALFARAGRKPRGLKL